MNLSKYHAFEEDDPQEGFEKDPIISEEVILHESSPYANWYNDTTAISYNSLKHRYSSSQKPCFSTDTSKSELRPLEQRYKNMKASDNVIRKRPLSIEEGEVLENEHEHEHEHELTSRVGRPKRTTNFRRNKSIASLESMMDAVVIKNKRTQIAESLSIAQGQQQQLSLIKSELLLNPQVKVAYKEEAPYNTFSFFKKLRGNTREACFVQSKYNFALKIKMQKSNVKKEQDACLQEEKLKPENCIQFRGDFQSGNLDFVTKIAEGEYNVHLRIDTNTRGHRSWFYFKAINHYHQAKRITLNIRNVTRRFSMVEKGQKIYIRSLNPPTEWSALDEEILIEQLGRKKFKISFKIELEAQQEMMISLIPPYTYSNLLKDLQEYEKSPNVKVDVLAHSITGLALPIVTISKGAARERKGRTLAKKKVFLISGRIHPSQTCSSYIINGLIKELIAREPHYEEFLTHNIIKIIPMLNPDGVVFGNFRTNFLGDDLNRSFFKNDETLYPETMALKELGKSLHNQYGENFLGFLDMHGHSGQTNSFVYGPEHEQSSDLFLECRIFPKILNKVSKYFKYEMSAFRLEEYKFNTARGYFCKKLKVPAYTIETSYALYYDKESPESRPKEMSVLEWQDFGCQIAQGLLSYFKYLQSVKQSVSVFGRTKNKKVFFEKREREDSKNSSCINFQLLKKEIQKQKQKSAKKGKANVQQLNSEESDGESEGQDLGEIQKGLILKKYKQITTPTFVLPKVSKTCLPLPAVIPSIMGVKKQDSGITSAIPKLVSKYRQKKLVRPLNLSYEYTQYLLKNIVSIGTMRPEIITLDFSKKKKEGSLCKNRSTISQL